MIGSIFLSISNPKEEIQPILLLYFVGLVEIVLKLLGEQYKTCIKYLLYDKYYGSTIEIQKIHKIFLCLLCNFEDW